MRISDWSSDVCSSDLRGYGYRRGPHHAGRCDAGRGGRGYFRSGPRGRRRRPLQIGNAWAPRVHPRLQVDRGGGAGVPSGRAVTGGKAGLPAATKLDPVIRLYPAKAASRSGALRFGPAELSVMLPFLGAGELLWTVEVAEPGEYDLALCYSTTHAGTPVTIEAGPSKVDFAARVTEGYFYPDPNGPSENPGDRKSVV